MFFKILFCLQVIWEKWLYEEDAFSELFIFIVFKNNNKVKINKILTLHSHIFILLLFSEKKMCLCFNVGLVFSRWSYHIGEKVPL